MQFLVLLLTIVAVPSTAQNHALTNEPSSKFHNNDNVKNNPAIREPSNHPSAPENNNTTLDEPVIAFTAELSANIAVSDGGTIIFDRVITRSGDNYLESIGVFGCTDDGLYALFWSIATEYELKGTNYGKATLMQGNEEVKYGPETSIIEFDHDVSSGTSQMTTLGRCSSGTGFRVIAHKFSDSQGSTEYFGSYSSFSGFQVVSDFGFSVELLDFTNVTANQKIPFDGILLNTNDIYDSVTHTMTCPGTGTFYFTWSIQGHGMSRASAGLVIETEDYLIGPTTHRLLNAGPKTSTSSASAVVLCSTGARIYIEAKDYEYTSTNYLEPKLTSWSGFRLGGSNYIAFTAQLTTNQTAIEGNTLVFDNVIINTGGHYDPASGQFVCPDADLYFFSWSIHNNIRAIYTHLQLDGTLVKSGPETSYVAGGGGQGSSGTSTMSAVVRCVEGSGVHVVFAAQLWSGLYAIPIYNTFSGFKIPGQ